MTTREIEARRYIRKCRRIQKATRKRIVLFLIAFCITLLCLWLSACQKDAPEVNAAPVATTFATASCVPTPTVEPTSVPRYRDDIISDGRLLNYNLQEYMQDCCEEYGVPYALALAIAEVETHFDPDAVSSTGDYGLMQINICNHEWLAENGIDVMTHEGNIEAGIYIISQHLAKYGEPELALMAYNCGAAGAKRLWDAGTYQTDYSRKVMTAFEHWTSVLEG